MSIISNCLKGKVGDVAISAELLVITEGGINIDTVNLCCDLFPMYVTVCVVVVWSQSKFSSERQVCVW